MAEPSVVDIWKAADYLRIVKTAWHNRFSTAELEAAETVMAALVRIGEEESV